MPPEEFMMPVSTPDAMAEMNIHALRQISDALTATNRSLTNLAADVKDVRERVIKIEGQDVKGDLRDLKADVKANAQRIDVLERARDRQDGAMSVGAWLSKHAPWLLAGIAAFAAGVGIKMGGAAP